MFPELVDSCHYDDDNLLPSAANELESACNAV